MKPATQATAVNPADAARTFLTDEARRAEAVTVRDAAAPLASHRVADFITLAKPRLNLLVLGRTGDAFRELSDAVRLDPRNADSLSALAFSELRLGRTAEARAHASAALAINPDDPLAKGILRGGGS